MTTQIEDLLEEVNRVYLHQQEIKRLKGEHFNIFSILQMEHKENETHSALLGELLNPDGNHLFKEIFLRHFIEVINYEGLFDISTARVQLEKHIGAVNLKEKTGGRIDIFISDSKGNIISIENKINAPDQEAQIERYVNFNKEKNTVYYLTLNGDTPKDKSVGELVDGNQYYCISYQHTIIKWLTLCLKEAVEQPMLREVIKQYILLVKKLTNQLSDYTMELEVITSIKNNYQAAKIIADNIWKAELEVTQVFLSELKENIEAELDKDCIIEIDEDLTQTWTGMTITFKEWNGIMVKLEGQSKIPWHDSVYGICANMDNWNRENLNDKLSDVGLLKSDFKHNHYWSHYQYILRFSQMSEKENLFDPHQRKIIATSTSEKLIELVNLCRIPLSKIKKIISH